MIFTGLDDIYDGSVATDEVFIEVSFTGFPPTLEIEKNVDTTLEDENLVDADGKLRIRKSYSRANPEKFDISLLALDYDDDAFLGLALKKEADLNSACADCCIDVQRSGRGITNRDKRIALRDKATSDGIGKSLRAISVDPKSELWKAIRNSFPEFVLFETDTKLGVGETTFQSQFRPIVKNAAEAPNTQQYRDAFAGSIEDALQDEVDKIFDCLQRHTDAFQALTAKVSFTWDKAVSFDIFGGDGLDTERSLEQRGSGLRRLLMVAFFQYLTERKLTGTNDVIFAVEEPENCLHPGVQRELVASFSELAQLDYQVIITSHSPVFAGSSPVGDLALVVREAGEARSIQAPDLDLRQVAVELGIEPCDQVYGYSACVFVEGKDDIVFLKTIANTLKSAGHISATFDDKRIGFINCGGDNIKYWVSTRAITDLSRRFGVMIDSDKKSGSYTVRKEKLNWKAECENCGGVFHILRKREIENYLHKDALARAAITDLDFDDYTDMKAKYGKNVISYLADMTCDEILESDLYQDANQTPHNELKEVIESFLGLVS